MSTRYPHQIRRSTASRIEGDKQQLQLEVYDGLAAFLLDPSEQTYHRMARMVSITRSAMRIQRLTDFDVQLRSAQAALDDIFDRWEATDTVIAYHAERMTLRAAAPALCEAIQRSSIRALADARDRTQAEMAIQQAPMRRHPFQ